MRAATFVVIGMLAACGQNPDPAPTPAQDPSAQAIIDRLPLIDACLALASGRRIVTINPALRLTLRLSGAGGDVDCVVPDDATDPANATLLPALDPPSGDAILFVRAPGENPGGECYEAPEVRSADGELLGWILDPDGC